MTTYDDGGKATDHTPIRELGIFIRASIALECAGIRTVGDLVAHSESDLVKIPNFGPKRLASVKRALGGIGLALQGDV